MQLLFWVVIIIIIMGLLAKLDLQAAIKGGQALSVHSTKG